MINRNNEHKDKTDTHKKQHHSKNNTIIKYIVGFFSLCIVFAGVFWFCYSYIINDSYNDYESKVSKIIVTINKSNSTTATLMKGSTIDTDKTKKSLSGITSTLQKQKDSISSLIPTSKYASSNSSLLQGITSNMNFYGQLLSVLNNPNGSDIATSLDNLNRLKTDTEKFYNEASVYNIKMGLSANTTKFMDSAIAYVTQLSKLEQNQAITNSQINDFTKAMDDGFKRFQSIKTDYKAEVLNIRAGLGTYDDLITKVADNKTALETLKIDLAKISIPSKNDKTNPLDIFNSLRNSLNDYDTYLDSFSYALSNEKAQTSKGDSKNDSLSKLYTTADLNIAKVITDYNNFVQQYNNFKNSK